MNEKLRTIKELGFVNANDFKIGLEVIRKEVIKWIKWFDEQEKRDFIEHSEGKNINYYFDTPNWIEHFFNITDEDLK